MTPLPRPSGACREQPHLESITSSRPFMMATKEGFGHFLKKSVAC